MGKGWRDIPGYEGLYKISKDGDVYSAVSDILLKTHMRKDGYLAFGLYKDGKRKTCYVHRTVALAFIGKRPDGLCVNHKDGVKTNNRLDNLEYITQSENVKHAISMGLSDHRGEKGHFSKLVNSNINKIRRLLDSREYSVIEIAKMFDVEVNTIYLIKRGSTWAHIEPDGDFNLEFDCRYKLNEHIVSDIKCLMESGECSQNEIAEKFGVSPQTISDIKSGRTWGEVEAK